MRFSEFPLNRRNRGAAAARGGELPDESKFRRWAGTSAGQVMVAVGVVGAYGSLEWGQSQTATAQPLPEVGLRCVGIVCSSIILSFGITTKARLRRLRARTVDLASDSADDASRVLYLRTFSTDPALARLSSTQSGWTQALMSRRTQEEELAAAVRTIGALVAVGQPGESLPYLGAMRGYLPVDRWQENVRRLLATARLVLLVAGHGSGLSWELARAVELVPPTRLVLLIPMDSSGYAGFRTASKHNFPRGLPEYIPGKPHFKSMRLKAAVYFEPDWTPRFVRLNRRRVRGNELAQTESTFVYQLKPVYDNLGAQWPGIRCWQPRWLSLTKRQLRLAAVYCLPVFMLLMLIGFAVAMR
jgi:hypothetical protein